MLSLRSLPFEAYAVVQGARVPVGWVDLNLSVPLSAQFCLGGGEFGRSGWAAGQDGGTQKSKSTQPRFQITWDTLWRREDLLQFTSLKSIPDFALIYICWVLKQVEPFKIV